MTLKDLCVPVTSLNTNNLGVQIVSTYEDSELVAADVFLLGYLEDRNSNNVGASRASAQIRKSLCALHETSKSLKIFDLGDCRQGENVSESYKNLEKCVELLSIYGKPIIVFGGTQEAVCSLAQVSLQRSAYPSVCLIDARIDREEELEDFHNQNYLNRLISENKDVRLVHIANQEYLSSRDSFGWMNDNSFYSLRLGECNSNIELSEPLIRDAQLVSFDANSVRFSDNPSSSNVNGLYSEYACQCAWYSGYSPRMNMFFLSEYNPKNDDDVISMQLCAQILWHVLDGISQRKNETGDFSDETYLKRYLKHPMFPQNICFYESMVSQTMWVEIPVGTTNKKRIVPCSLHDYEQFKNGTVPDSWIVEYQRLAK
ncbi:MAG: hypothetical protein MJ198_08940 [Bacteroidales bacterium]|nr:hypothetical protein [Bacteroidales bacterium]